MNTSTPTSSNPRFKNLPWIAAIVLGFVAWFVLAAVTVRREAWDDPRYYLALLLALSIYAGVAGWLSPERAWLVAPALAAGQFAGLCVQNPGGSNLWPLSLAIIGALHVPALLLALLGGRLRRRRATMRAQ